MSWSTLLLSRPTRVVATIGLTISLAIGNNNLPWLWILFFALVVVVHEIGTYVRERRGPNGLGLRYGPVQRRVSSLITDLAELGGRNFDFWVLDIYLLRTSFPYPIGRRRVVELVREFSFGLTAVSDVPLTVRANEGLVWASFSESSRKLWWNPDLDPRPSGENQFDNLSESENRRLRNDYGAISVNPIVDHLGRKCKGLLVIHVKPDMFNTTTAVGVFTAEEGVRRLVEACNAIHRELG